VGMEGVKEIEEGIREAIVKNQMLLTSKKYEVQFWK
jgi:hypothetical protein